MPDETEYSPRSGPRDRRLRVGSAEREAVADILRREHLGGRLDDDEFEERLARCLTAKTYAELDELIADFPAGGREARSVGRGWGWQRWPLLVPALVVIAIAASGGHLFWPAFALIFFFVLRPLLWRSRGVRGRGMWGCGPRHTTGGRP
jgi:hypothetical protein